MRRMLTTVLVAGAVLMSAVPSHAAENIYQANYTGTGPVAIGLILNSGDPEVGGIGGYIFTGTEGTPSRLQIVDAAGQVVRFNVAQDLDGNLRSGEAKNSAGNPEPTITGCGKDVNLETSLVPFVEGLPIAVFLYAATTSTSTACRGALGTTGTLTLTTVTP